MKLTMMGALVALPLALYGCKGVTTDVNAGAGAAQGPLATACSSLVTMANVAALVPGVGSLVPYVTAGCQTAEGFAKLLADPSSLEWVGQLEGNVKALAGKAGLKL